jgi:peptidoglycan glycosyltransferase
LNAPAVRELLNRNRDVRSSIDARLQVRAAAALQRRMDAGGYARGAAVVLDADTGDVLASVSYPWPRSADLKLRDPAKAGSEEAERLFDRTRYGLYPPGSTFKLLVAAAALRTNHQHETFACIRLPDGRVGNYVAGTPRPVRDDPMDTSPHGSVDLHRGLVVSCNAYFAQLAIRIGPDALMEAASMFQIDVSQPPTAAALRRNLAQAGYGQGQVVVSPAKVARLAAAISTRGRVPPAQWIVGGGEDSALEPQLLPAADAALLSRYMRDVVVLGTGRALATNPTPIAGKTGTAEIANGRAHSWFAGFAPYGGEARRRIAFAVVIENAGYGARAAAPIAGDLVTAARELGLIQ